MKEDEIKFFKACYRYCRYFEHPETGLKHWVEVTPRNVIGILSEFIHYKRCWYLLKKWCEIGFYNYGVTLDLGWIEPDKLPERYAVLVEDIR